MSLLRILMYTLLLTVPTVQADALLTLTFSHQAQTTARVYGTATQNPTAVLSVVSGQQVILEKNSGRDYRLQAAPFAYYWTQVQQVSREATAIAVTPELNGQQVTLQVYYHEREADEELSYQSTVQGKLGQWIPLLQATANSGTEQTKVWHAGDSGEPLAVKVELAR